MVGLSTRADAIIFDMDGVLLDSEPLHFEATRVLLAPLGVTYTDEENAEFFGCTDLHTLDVLRRRHGLAATTTELLGQRASLVVSLVRERAVPMPGVPDVLVALRAAGYRLALASSSGPGVIAATLAALGVETMFDVVVSGEEVPHGKPAPDVFLEAARRLGVAPARCLVVEDSKNGLLAAGAAGMACAVVPCAATATQDFSGATVQLRSLPDLLAALGARPA